MTPHLPVSDLLGRDSFLSDLQAAVASDPRLRAAWLEGSLGRGSADRYSDVDLHLLVAEADIVAFRAAIEGWLRDIRPLALFNLLFRSAMVNAMTMDALRLDVWPHAGEHIDLEAARVRVLHAVPGAVTLNARSMPPDRGASARYLLGLLHEFWRCISMLPAVIGRQERLVAVQGLAVELGLVTELLIAGSGTVRDRGVKHANPFLPPDLRARLEAEVLPADLGEQALADAHLRLARLVQEQGPDISARFDFTYPQELEDVVLKNVWDELAGLGLNVSTTRP
ncbi:hypothetical protein [Deinococcus sp.]|uniref:hypothetical protein n=1 Tax=Deinococcus sp. TaxID=47478 RepID=UPI002869B789|nr:hypothetical protein [Deinococcus sp.]